MKQQKLEQIFLKNMGQNEDKSKKGWEIFLAVLGAVLGAVFSTIATILTTSSSNSTGNSKIPEPNTLSDFFTVSSNILTPFLTFGAIIMSLLTLSLILRIFDILDIFDSDFWDFF
jgi:NADH:ubiquinone oxidoreductase subunit 6 (subunit J)